MPSPAALALRVTGARRPLPPLVLACLAATWLIWGSTYLAIKLALVGFPPFLQMGSRFVVAGLALAAWMRLVRRAPWPDARQWRSAFVVGSLMLAGGMGPVAVVEQSVGSGLVVVFVAVVPLMIVLLNLAWRVVPGRLELLGIGVGLAGVLLLTQGAGFRASPGGVATLAFATFSWSLGSVLSQRALPLAPGAMGFASEMLAGGVVLSALAWASGESMAWPVPPLALGAWAYLVVFGSLIAFNAYMLLLARAPASLAASYTFVNPIIGMLLGVTLGGETITRGEWAAAGVVLAGVVLLLVAPRR